MIILDTNVLSELMRNRPSPKVTAWFHEHPLIDLYTTAITEAEIFYGMKLLEHGTRRQKLLMAAESLFAIDLKNRVISFDGDAARIFSQIAAHRGLQGKPISNPDAQIAAIVQYTAPRLRLATLLISATAGSMSLIPGALIARAGGCVS